MPIAEIAGDLLAVIGRFVGRVFVEIVIEILIKGCGYLICRPFNKNIDPDGWVVTVVGLGIWALVGGVVYTFVLYPN